MPGARRRRAVGTGAATFSDLTRRACSKNYDVVRYQFTVVMPMRYLSDLKLNLLRRTNHTILNVNMNKAATLPVTDGRRTRATADDLYYYGTDSVVEVTLGCELLLMTAWERGTYDFEAGKWSRQFPPLMPKEVLSNLQELVPDAIRQEDEMRLKER